MSTTSLLLIAISVEAASATHEELDISRTEGAFPGVLEIGPDAQLPHVFEPLTV